jgi:hypothetical protein
MIRRLSVGFMIAIILVSLQTTKAATSKLDLSGYTRTQLDEKKKDLKLERNQAIANRCLDYYKSGKKSTPINKIGFDKLAKLINKYPQLKEYRDAFERADKDLKSFIHSKDPRYKDATEKYKKKLISRNEMKKVFSSVYRSLEKSHTEEFVYLKKQWINSIRMSKFKTLEYLVNDYNKSKKIFPISWIPKKDLKIIAKEDFILKLTAIISEVNNEIIKRIWLPRFNKSKKSVLGFKKKNTK